MTVKDEFHASDDYRNAYAAWMIYAAPRYGAVDESMLNHFNGSAPYWEAFNRWITANVPI